MRSNVWKNLEHKVLQQITTRPRPISTAGEKYIDSGNDIMSLGNKSRKPKSHSNEYTEIEVKLIKDMRHRNSNAEPQDLWIKLKKRGYTRTIQGLGKALNRF